MNILRKQANFSAENHQQTMSSGRAQKQLATRMGMANAIMAQRAVASHAIKQRVRFVKARSRT
jgi:hypothetical protein